MNSIEYAMRGSFVPRPSLPSIVTSLPHKFAVFLFAVGYWLLAALTNSFFSFGSTFSAALLPTEPRELWMRCLAVAAIVALGFYRTRSTASSGHAEEELNRSQENLARAQQIAHLGSWKFHIESGRLEWSDEVFRIFGHEPGKSAPTYDTFLDHVHPDDRDAVVDAVDNAIRHSGTYSLEHRIVHPGGEWRTVHSQGEVQRDSEGRAVSMMGIVQDITERKSAQDAIEFMANFDALTGLPNRSLMQYRLQQAISQAHRQGHGIALLLLDVDRFKTVNDTLGHASGDALLKNIAERLTRNVPEGDTVARLSGDEFAVILDGLDDVEHAADVVQRLREAISFPLMIETHELFPSASIGIALYPYNGQDSETLLRHADAALRRAKVDGFDRYEFFTADMTSESIAHLRLEADLRRALERGEFELFYQPQVDVPRGHVVGFEALLRWRHGDKLISPAEFIPVLEDTGLILPVGRWVLEEACRQNKAWQEAGLPPVRVSVNLSALQFRQNSLPDEICAAFDKVRLDARWLELEITESLLIDSSAAIKTLSALHQMGLQIAIDDFGTGYSSLGYLQRFPVHELKIDRSFIKDMITDQDSAAITKAILALAHSLRLRVVAEGVETADQLALLEAHGCDHVQGFFFSKPLPAADVPAWLARFSQSRAAAS